MTYGIVLDILYLIDVEVPSDSCAFLKTEKTLNVSVELMLIHEKNEKKLCINKHMNGILPLIRGD